MSRPINSSTTVIPCSHLKFRRRSRLSYRYLIFVFFVCYIAFIPSGPYPIFMQGLRLDLIVAAVLFLLLLPYVNFGIKFYPKIIVQLMCFYLLATLISSIFSTDPQHSLAEWFKTVGYVIVTLISPIIIFTRLAAARAILFFIAVLVSSLILYLYLFQGYGHDFRFALSLDPRGRASETAVSVDPNFTAIGLTMSSIIYVANFSIKRISVWRLAIKMSGFVVVFLAIAILASRTAFIALFLAVFLVALSLSLKGFARNNAKPLFLGLIAVLILCFSLLAAGLLQPDAVSSLFSRLSSSFDDSERLGLFKESFLAFSESGKTVLIGTGFMTINPHNEYVRALVGAGVLGFSCFSLLIISIYFSIVRKFESPAIRVLSSKILYFFIIIAMLFYPNVKTLWVSLLFLFAEYHSQKSNIAKYE